MKKGAEKFEKPYAEKVLDRASAVKNLLQKLNINDAKKYLDKDGVEIFVVLEGEAMRIGYEGLVDFVIGKAKLSNNENDNNYRYMKDLRSTIGNGGNMHYQMSELAKYTDATFSTKIGKTDLTARELFELLDRCLIIARNDLMSQFPVNNNVVDITNLFGKRLKSSSGTR